MAKFSEYIAVSPINLTCPRRKMKPGKACDLLAGEVEIVHVERIAAAAAIDVKARKLRAANPS